MTSKAGAAVEPRRRLINPNGMEVKVTWPVRRSSCGWVFMRTNAKSIAVSGQLSGCAAGGGASAGAAVTTTPTNVKRTARSIDFQQPGRKLQPSTKLYEKGTRDATTART